MNLGTLIDTHGYWVLAVGCLVEAETVLVLAGFAAHRGHLDLGAVIGIAALTGFVGDQCGFWLGRRHGAALLAHWPWLARQSGRVQQLAGGRHGVMIIGLRFAYGLRLAGPLLLGTTAAIPALRFALLDALGAVLWASLVASLGWAFGEAAERVLGELRHLEGGLMLGLVAAAALYAGVYRRRTRAGAPAGPSFLYWRPYPTPARKESPPPMTVPLISDELDLLQSLVDLAQHPRIIELGCGAAQLSRRLLARHPGCTVTGLEVDQRQQAKNLQNPAERLQFVTAGAQAIPFGDGQFDLALMLKSLHHVPLDLLDQALAEVHRVLRPGGLLYVSEPVFAGALNEVMRLFHDEEKVRAAALQAVQRAVASGAWEQVTEQHFEMPVHYRDFAEFEQRMIGVTFVDHRLDAATLAAVRARFEPHMTADGAHFTRPMRVNLLRRR